MTSPSHMYRADSLHDCYIFSAYKIYHGHGWHRQQRAELTQEGQGNIKYKAVTNDDAVKTKGK